MTSARTQDLLWYVLNWELLWIRSSSSVCESCPNKPLQRPAKASRVSHTFVQPASGRLPVATAIPRWQWLSLYISASLLLPLFLVLFSWNMYFQLTKIAQQWPIRVFQVGGAHLTYELVAPSCFLGERNTVTFLLVDIYSQQSHIPPQILVSALLAAFQSCETIWESLCFPYKWKSGLATRGLMFFKNTPYKRQSWDLRNIFFSIAAVLWR